MFVFPRLSTSRFSAARNPPRSFPPLRSHPTIPLLFIHLVYYLPLRASRIKSLAGQVEPSTTQRSQHTLPSPRGSFRDCNSPYFIIYRTRMYCMASCVARARQTPCLRLDRGAGNTIESRGFFSSSPEILHGLDFGPRQMGAGKLGLENRDWRIESLNNPPLIYLEREGFELPRSMHATNHIHIHSRLR